jgi:myo-inositol 2-dehydrogenase/D-chiro-inositol 1-dehydrogenase
VIGAPFLVRFEDAHRADLAEFLRVARRTGAQPLHRGRRLAALEVPGAATRSLHEHRPVRVAEVR